MNTSNHSRFTPRGLIPTREQTAIQLAQDKVVLVDANAGAAKTTTLAIRIGEALARNLAPELILALVFTPEARDVMRERLIDVGIPRATALRIEVATFEDFAAKTLKLIEGDVPQRCAQAKDLRKYALDAIEQVGLSFVGKVEYLDLKTHNIALSQFLDVQLGLKATMALDGDFEFMGVEEAAAILNVPLADYLTTREFERIRLGGFEGPLFRGPYDATYDLARKLGEDVAAAAHMPAYRVVVCDELHDLNEAAFRILNALLARPQCYFIGAGDKDQVIHSKLGASESYLKRRFVSSYPALVRYPLTLSYRHGPHLAYAMAQFKRKPVDSDLPLHTEIRHSHYEDSADACAARVVEAIGAWRRDKLPLDGCAILVRDRHQSVAIENALMQAGIAYRTGDMPGYLQREEILFLRGMIAIALKNLGAVKSDAVRRAIVESLAIFGEVALTPSQMEEAKKTIARDPETLSYFFSGQLQRSQAEGVRDQISDTVAYVEAVDPEAKADLVLSEICARMNLETLAKRIYVHPYDASVVSKSVAGFIAAAAKSGFNLRQFSEWLGGAETLAGQKTDKHRVLLECVANAKGKEFDHVILPFLEAGEFPSPMFAQREEENLFYVGATRTRARLTLISPQQEQRRSPFIAQMGLGASLARANVAVANNSARADVAKPKRHDLKVAFADKNEVKALGAEWDLARRVWFVAGDKDLTPFAPWLPR